MTTYLSLSGGMDSTALLALLAAGGHGTPIIPVGFDYGQRHVRELASAAEVAEAAGLGLLILPMDTPTAPSSLTADRPVPHGHYADDTMAATVVQGRNLGFISRLVALTQPGDRVAIGVHTGDHAIYPDCRPAFIEPLRQALAAAYKVTLLAPFLHVDKAEIVRVGARYDARFDLSWSCYEGGDTHCGRCGTCVERAEAFHIAGVPDPTDYTDPEFWKQATGL